MTDEGSRERGLTDGTQAPESLAYHTKGLITLDDDGNYVVDGHDSAEPRHHVRIAFSLPDIAWVQEYEAGPNKSEENDAIFYPNVTRFLAQHIEAGSIVLIHDQTPPIEGAARQFDIEVQFDLRPRE